MHVSIVYLGDSIPKYLYLNLQYLKITFPDQHFVFISDSDDSIKKISKLGIATWKFLDLEETIHKYRSHLEHDWSFRSNFWFNTLARYFAINAYMLENPDNKHLHLEADNFLFPNFPFRHFEETEENLAFPMESENMGVASVLFIPDLNALSTLIKSSIDEIADNSFATDMTILGKIANDHNFVTTKLRVLPVELSQILNTRDKQSLFTTNSNLEGIFDAITHGQYLLGIDPRNSRGIRKVFSAQSSHSLNPNKISYKFDSERGLHIEHESKVWMIYNLHNHAKDLKLYEFKRRNKLLLSRISQIETGERNEFLPIIFIKAVYFALKRRIKNLISL